MTKANLPVSISYLTIIGMFTIFYSSAPALADCGFEYENDIENDCPMEDENGDPIWFKGSDGKYRSADDDKAFEKAKRRDQDRKADKESAAIRARNAVRLARYKETCQSWKHTEYCPGDYIYLKLKSEGKRTCYYPASGAKHFHPYTGKRLQVIIHNKNVIRKSTCVKPAAEFKGKQKSWSRTLTNEESGY